MRTVGVGEEGNDAPFKVIEESWTAVDTNMRLRSLYDDPRNGRSVWELVTFTKGAPDPALFAPPSGYVIWDPEAKPAGQGAP